MRAPQVLQEPAEDMTQVEAKTHGISAAVTSVPDASLVSSLGVVKHLSLEHVPPWEPQFRLVTADIGNGLTTAGAETGSQRLAYGSGRDVESAAAAALGEAVERYCAREHRGSVGERELSLAPLDQLPMFDDAELSALGNPYAARWAEGDIRHWSVVRRPASSDRLRVPTQLVALPCHPDPEEPLIWVPTATGLAAGRDCDQAVAHGLLEVIERDAVACHWFSGTPGTPVELDRVPELNGLLAELLRGELSADVCTLENDFGVIVSVARLRSHGATPECAFGSSAAFGLIESAQGALLEAALVRYSLALAAASGVLEPQPDGDPATFFEHGASWSVPGSSNASDWLFEAAPGPHGRERSDPFGACGIVAAHALIERVEARGHPVLVADTTTPELLRADWHACRVVVPGLQPLNPGRHRVMRDSPRILRSSNHSGHRHDHVHPFC